MHSQEEDEPIARAATRITDQVTTGDGEELFRIDVEGDDPVFNSIVLGLHANMLGLEPVGRNEEPNESKSSVGPTKKYSKAWDRLMERAKKKNDAEQS